MDEGGDLDRKRVPREFDLSDGTRIVTDSSSNITATGFTSPTVYVDGSSASAKIADTNWHFVVVTTATGLNADDFSVASTTSSIKPFGGAMDDVRLYNRAISADEIKRLYALGNTTHIAKTLDTQPALENGLLLHWSFDGKNIGPTVLDSSGNGHNGNLIFASTPAGIIFNETCTVGADTLLSNHTPDIGSSWTLAVTTVVRLVDEINATGRIDISAGGSNQGEVYTADTIYSTANYIVRATATTLTSASAYSLLVCRITDTTPGSEHDYMAIKGFTLDISCQAFCYNKLQLARELRTVQL